MFNPRPAQEKVLAYRGGWMGVSAVPGSGKTWTLSYLAADLLTEVEMADDQELLIVTFSNSAVDNFRRQIDALMRERGLLEGVGYRVRTLHGLAHDIVRERPGHADLANEFEIIDERESRRILESAVDIYLRAHPDAWEALLDPDLDDNQIQRTWSDRQRMVSQIALAVMRTAKDQEHIAEDLLSRIQGKEALFPLATMGAAIYADYQHALRSHGRVDFDDLIQLAVRALEWYPEYLETLRYRWMFVLEDEAQDSSRLQEQLLRMLVGETGNWVRVGDPNQAIYESFTTSNPKFLRDFLEEDGVVKQDLPNSGRSTQTIMDLANYLIEWSRTAHPVDGVRGALAPPPIVPTPPGDPQPNPDDSFSVVHFVRTKFDKDAELNAVAKSLIEWVPDHTDQTIAVLVPTNAKGAKLASWLAKHGLEVVELLRNTQATRSTAGSLANVLACLDKPASPARLATAFEVWRRRDKQDADAWKQVKTTSDLLRRCSRVEEFVWPRATGDWLASLDVGEESSDRVVQLEAFREVLQRWFEATELPVDQLVITVAQDLFDEPADLALAHKLAAMLRWRRQSYPEWQLPQFVEEMANIAKNRRDSRLAGFSDADTGFDPDSHRGKVIVATMHKAKGLEFDYVHLMGVNNFVFPSAQEHDTFMGERWYVRDQLNLEAEALAQTEALLEGALGEAMYVEGEATQRARLEYAAERLRLLYVGITRAKMGLIATWNTGRFGDNTLAAPIVALQAFLDERKKEMDDDTAE